MLQFVADWSQAKIGYTTDVYRPADYLVADWSQAKIGYTCWSSTQTCRFVADWSQAKIGYTRWAANGLQWPLRIGLRPRLVTLHSNLT